MFKIITAAAIVIALGIMAASAMTNTAKAVETHTTSTVNAIELAINE